jgi:hypothetical protein
VTSDVRRWVLEYPTIDGLSFEVENRLGVEGDGPGREVSPAQHVTELRHQAGEWRRQGSTEENNDLK